MQCDTSKEIAIFPSRSDRGAFLNLSISVFVLATWADTFVSNGWRMFCNSHPRRSKIPFRPLTIGRIASVGLWVFGSE